MFKLVRDLRDLGVVGIEVLDHRLVRRHRRRPDDAVLVVALLDHGLHGAAHADAVAAHHHHLLLELVRLVHGLERIRVLRAELEDVAHLDAAADRHRLAALRADVAVAHDDEVGVVRLGDVAVAREVHVLQVVVVAVRPDDAALRALQLLVADDGTCKDGELEIAILHL